MLIKDLVTKSQIVSWTIRYNYHWLFYTFSNFNQLQWHHNSLLLICTNNSGRSSSLTPFIATIGGPTYLTTHKFSDDPLFGKSRAVSAFSASSYVKFSGASSCISAPRVAPIQEVIPILIKVPEYSSQNHTETHCIFHTVYLLNKSFWNNWNEP